MCARSLPLAREAATLLPFRVHQDGRCGRIHLFQNTPAAFHGRPDAVAALTAELQRESDALARAQSGSR
jgi:hypothetical protein